MARRLHQTLADYVVIAISPALIMALVGSLVYFLLAVFYQGQYQERLHWVMACFVFAAVLIGRISIEEGFERAAPFGAALAILVGIAAYQFMEYQGTWVDDFGWIINFALIGIIWWCAHKLTWDCTVIDDAQDSSGEGLMQVAGLERPADERNAAADEERRLEGTTSRGVPAGYWQRYVEHQRRPHAPGVWVVYFSLAALPIFGVGGWFIPASDTAARRYVFGLLCIYVASGLGLLVTTSFLGLRRYLRQRRIEMPTAMANVWLGIGLAIILTLVVAAALVPRPSAEYAISELPFTLGSPEAGSSQIAPSKREGTKDDEPGPAAAEKPQDDEPTDDEKPTGAGNQPQGEAQGEDASSKPSSDSQSKSEGKRGESSSSEGRQRNAESKGGQNARAEGDRANQPKESPSDAEERSKIANALKRLKQQEEPAKAADDQPSADEDQGKSEAAPEPTEPSEPGFSIPSETAISPLVTLLKWAFYALFVLAVLYALWRYRHDVLAAFRNFLVELRALWDALLGRRRDYGVAADLVLEIKIPASPFSSFADPFTSGLAGRSSIEELVRYSFEAFEAWSREHGCARQPEQTPHELARDVARLNSFIAAEARHIAELYARAAYAKGALPEGSTEQLRQLWRKMQSTTGVRTITAQELQSWT
ncbi:MAG: DUF4129 domain-containing protein [Pirellulales bacterium]